MPPRGIATEDFAQIEIASPAALRDWLEAHHGQTESVWLVTALKNAPADARGDAGYLSTDDILDALLAYG